MNTSHGARALSWLLAISGSAAALCVLTRQRKAIEGQKRITQEKIDILDSMAEIYDNVNLISFVENTEMSLRDAEQQKHGIDLNAQTHTLMNQRLKNHVVPEHLDAFLTFTNITTVRERMRNKKIISADFIDEDAGWFRAQYIMVQQAPDGLPDVVIYTTRNVDDEKRREESLIRLSLTDELTGLRNRRCYVEDLAELRNGELDGGLVVFSVDVNGLKAVNDQQGHAAGDNLIKAASIIFAQSIGKAGRVYRVGGDEFVGIARTSAPERMREAIREKASSWQAPFAPEVALSVGYAAHADHPHATIDDLERLADADMYAEKKCYYQEAGANRGAHAALQASPDADTRLQGARDTDRW